MSHVQFMMRMLAAVLAVYMVGTASLLRAAEPLTVVELFTSQGCSSCPPADAILAELADRDDVLALSQHVDYWDYLGWSDPFASAAASERQRSYARRFGLAYVYTPQMVIHGDRQLTGSDRRAVDRQVAAARALPRIDIALRRLSDATVEVSIGRGRPGDAADIWLVFYDHQHATDIGHGENGGSRLSYAHVMRSYERIGGWSGEPVILPLDLSRMTERGEACAILVQQPETGRIFGAARFDQIPSP